MKVAMIYGGESRFKRYLELNYKRLQNYSEVHLYFCLWNNFEYTDMNLNFSDIESNNVIKKINHILPKKFYLKNLVEIEKPDISEKSKEIKNILLKSNEHFFQPDIDGYIERLLFQRYSLYECFKLLKEEYDCIIRYRIDGYPTKRIDLRKLNLSEYVYSPNNMRQGISDFYPRLNDQFAIGNQNKMEIYCNSYEYIEDYIKKDAKNGQFETSLSCHLTENNVKIKTDNFSYHLIREETGFIL